MSRSRSNDDPFRWSTTSHSRDGSLEKTSLERAGSSTQEPSSISASS